MELAGFSLLTSLLEKSRKISPMLSRYAVPKIAHLFKVRSYPSVPLKDRNQLPRDSGIYYCLRGWRILYIGKSSDIYQRWNSYQYGEHHKLEDLLKIEESIGDIDIHYCILPKWQIGFDEAVEINRFKPRLNKRRENIWDNLNLKVIQLLLIKGLSEFILMFVLGLLLVFIIHSLL